MDYVASKKMHLKALFGQSCCHNGVHVVDGILYLEGDVDTLPAISALLDRVHTAVWKPIKQLVLDECSKQNVDFDASVLESTLHEAGADKVSCSLPHLVCQLLRLADTLTDRSLVYHAHVFYVEVDRIVNNGSGQMSSHFHNKSHPIQSPRPHPFPPLFAAHDKLKARYHRSISLIAIGRYKEAINVLVECISSCEGIWGQESLYGICIVNTLAEAWGGEGHWDKAIAFYKQAVLSLQSLPISPHDELYVHTVAGQLCALSLAHLRGSARPMLSMLKELLMGTEVLTSTLEPSFFRFHRGLVYQQFGVGQFFERRYKEAEQTLYKAMKLCKGSAGETKDYYLVMHNLGVVMEAQGQYYRALECYQESVDKLLYMLGETHPLYLMCLHSLAVFLYAQYRYEEALPLFVQCVALRAVVLGKGHRDTLASLNNQANCLACMHRVAEAIALFQDCASLEVDVLGLDHGDLGITLCNLANCYYSEGKLQQAAVVFNRCLPLLENAFSKTNAHTVHVVEKLGLIERKLQAEGK
ncbi:tetratricopeptide repeat protein [archaeon]|nr:MAG: tetratricopeptide repeat protein [archaeon]